MQINKTLFAVFFFVFLAQALLSQKDIAASLAEDLLKQFAQEGELDLEQPQPVVAPTQPATNLIHNPPSNIRIAKEPTPVLAIGGPMGRSTTPRNRGGLKGMLLFGVLT